MEAATQILESLIAALAVLQGSEERSAFASFSTAIEQINHVDLSESLDDLLDRQVFCMRRRAGQYTFLGSDYLMASLLSTTVMCKMRDCTRTFFSLLLAFLVFDRLFPSLLTMHSNLCYFQ